MIKVQSTASNSLFSKLCLSRFRGLKLWLNCLKLYMGLLRNVCLYELLLVYVSIRLFVIQNIACLILFG